MDIISCNDKNTVWDYAPNLPHILADIFLERSVNTSVHEQMSLFFVHIDDQNAKPLTVVEIFLHHIGIFYFPSFTFL